MTKYKILVADDNKSIRSMIVHYLQKKGFIVLEVTNGKEAVLAEEENNIANKQYELSKKKEFMELIDNNRNLKDFSVNLDQSIKLLEKLPKKTIKISESGLKDPEMVNHLREKGFRGFLMGENFMKTNNPAESCRDFILKLTQ